MIKFTTQYNLAFSKTLLELMERLRFAIYYKGYYSLYTIELIKELSHLYLEVAEEEELI